jgi:hypothetical protein
MRELRSIGLLSAALLLLGAGSLEAQRVVDFEGLRTNWLVGYVANPPEQLVGLGFGAIFPNSGGWGFQVNLKTSTDSPRNDFFEPDITPADASQFGDFFFRDRSHWRSANVAVVKAISSDFALYLGGGLSDREVFFQYEDPLGERGNLGIYWVQDDEQSEVYANVVVGAFFRLGRRLVVQFGAERAPAGVTAGGLFLVH